nr:uncharacterized protein LOC129276349 [Lytechinus pictus]
MPSWAPQIVIVALCLGQIFKAEGERMSCMDARLECQSDEFCKLGLMAINVHCGNVDGGRCEATALGLPTCLMMLQDSRIHGIFGGCFCDPTSPQYAACRYHQRLINSNPCMNATGSFHPPPTNSAEPTSATLPPSANCFKTLKACKEDTVCHQNLEHFYDACPTRRHGTCRLSSQAERVECTAAHGVLDSKLLYCTCEENKTKCKRQRKRIQENPCVISEPTSADVTDPTPHELTVVETVKGGEEEELEQSDDECPVDETNLVIGPSGGYNNGESTCKEALTECTRNEMCRQDFSELITQCNPQEIEEYCDRSACRSIVRKFFTDTSPIYTHGLVFCHCQEGDLPCATIQKGSNPTCARSGIENLDCLDVVEQCNEDSYCRSAYRNYLELCKPSDDESGCTYSYGACRSARVAIIGTIMGSSCSCDSNNTDCRYHMRMFFDNACYDLAAKGFYSSVAPTEPPELSAAVCIVNSSQNGVPYRVKPGSYALVSFDGRCYSLCVCVYNGNMENCVSQPCPEDAHCLVNNIEFKNNELFSHSSYGHCICLTGKVLCTSRHGTGSSGKQTQHVSPSISIAYDSVSLDHLNSQLDESIGDSSIISDLQTILDHQEPVPCQLQLLEHTDNTILISVYYTDNMNSCFNQLYRLSNMINSKHPAITLNPVLSSLKIATVERGTYDTDQKGQASPTRLISNSLLSYVVVVSLGAIFSLSCRTA